MQPDLYNYDPRIHKDIGMTEMDTMIIGYSYNYTECSSCFHI